MFLQHDGTYDMRGNTVKYNAHKFTFSIGPLLKSSMHGPFKNPVLSSTATESFHPLPLPTEGECRSSLLEEREREEDR